MKEEKIIAFLKERMITQDEAIKILKEVFPETTTEASLDINETAILSPQNNEANITEDENKNFIKITTNGNANYSMPDYSIDAQNEIKHKSSLNVSIP